MPKERCVTVWKTHSEDDVNTSENIKKWNKFEKVVGAESALLESVKRNKGSLDLTVWFFSASFGFRGFSNSGYFLVFLPHNFPFNI